MTNETQTKQEGEEKSEVVSTLNNYAACGNERCSYNKIGKKIFSRNGQKPNYCGNCGYQAVPYIDEEVREKEQEGLMKVIIDRDVNESTRIKLLERLDDSYLLKVISDNRIGGCIRANSLTRIKDQEKIYQGIIERRKLDRDEGAFPSFTWEYPTAISRLTLENLDRLYEKLRVYNENKKYDAKDPLEYTVQEEIRKKKQNIAEQLVGEKETPHNNSSDPAQEERGFVSKFLERLVGGRK